MKRSAVSCSPATEPLKEDEHDTESGASYPPLKAYGENLCSTGPA